MHICISKRSFFTLIASTVAITAMAATPVDVIAPISRVNLFLMASSTAIQSSAYVSPAPTHSLFGSMGFLIPAARSSATLSDTTTVQQKLQNTLNMSGMRLAAGKLGYMAIDETGASWRYQCTAFAKSMTGVGGTATWKRGNALVAGTTYTPGTMIAHFDGNTTYGSNPHVAIILSTAYDPNTKAFIGYNVVDQNAVNSVSTGTVGDATQGTGGVISKHFLPWNSGSAVKVLSSKNYHVVQI